jgi:hypothetical protein
MEKGPEYGVELLPAGAYPHCVKRFALIALLVLVVAVISGIVLRSAGIGVR